MTGHKKTPPHPDTIPTDPAAVITPDQVAVLTGYSEKTISNWRYAGRGPKWHRNGAGDPRYLRGDVDRWNAGEVADQVDTPMRPARSSKARPKKAPPRPSLPHPAKAQAAPVSPDDDYLAEIDAALERTRVAPPRPHLAPVDPEKPPSTVGDLEDAVAALVAMKRPRGDAERAAVLAATSGARGVSEIVRGAQAILSGRAPVDAGKVSPVVHQLADEVDAGEAVDVQAAEGKAGPSEVDLEAFGDEVVRHLVADGMSEADADTYVAFAFDDLDPSEITAEALLERARYHAVMMAAD